MNKKRLINQIANRRKLKKGMVKLIVEDVFSAITEAMSSGEQVRIVGFGAFEVRKRIARVGRNPQTGAKIKISATNSPSFIAGKALKDAVKE